MIGPDDPVDGTRKRLPAMSPDERRLWLAAKGAPADMFLITAAELGKLQGALASEHQIRVGHERGIAALCRQLGPYWVEQPDLPNAVAAALFDADKFTKVRKTFGALRTAKGKLDRVIATAQATNFAIAADLIDVSATLDEKLRVLEEADRLRRERGDLTRRAP
jgi:hypothetical protein